MAKVTYKGNGNTGGSVPVDNNTYNAGDTVTVLGDTGTLVKSGNSFASWNTVAAGSGTVQAPGSTFVIGASNVSLFAQYYTTAGLTAAGTTPHYQFRYDNSLTNGGLEPARTNAVIAKCEADFAIMKAWFGGIELSYSYPISILVANASGGASWGPPITLSGGNGNADFQRDLLVAEVTEMFMLAQDKGWFAPDKSNEQSSGEGLSHFLNEQFEIGDGRPPGLAFNAANWLNSSLPSTNPSSTRFGAAPTSYDYGSRYDYVNNVLEYDHSNSPASGCSVMFLWYLSTQLGYGTGQICQAAAPTLGGVYKNLSGDNADPFPFFKLVMDNAYPPDTMSAIPGPNPDDPFPLALASFWVDKNTFGKSEVQDILNTHAGKFNNAFWVVIEGFSIDRFIALSIDVGAFSGAFSTVAGVTISRSTTPIHFENPARPDRLQRIRIAYDVSFTAASLASFPTATDAPQVLQLDTQVTSAGTALRGGTCRTIFQLSAGANPYFTNIDPAQNNVFWLSQDLRVFTAVPGKNNVPVPGGPNFGSDTIAGAFDYATSLLNYLNSNFGDPSGTDPFSSLIPGQAGASSGDSSVLPLTIDINFPSINIYTNYNFAVARVRLRGLSNDVASNVRVFFRLWTSQTADTDFQPTTTYLSTLTAGHPSAPLVATDNRTIPFFASGNLGSNTDYGAGGANNRDIKLDIGDSKWAYFGCFLNVYDQGNIIAGQPIQALLAGTHHCIVAEIAYDDAPILNSNAVTLSPENSDKLAQRNLQFTASDNPGGAASHRIPQTFDVRPSLALEDVVGSLLNYPDELMIDWGETPVGSTAHIYWPQVNAAEVLALAKELYSYNELSAEDAHTIQCDVTKGVTYIPIPPGAGDSFAGLLTIDLPTSVVTGQEFNVIVRRITTHRAPGRVPMPTGVPIVRAGTELPGTPQPPVGAAPVGPQFAAMVTRNRGNWRCVTGTFQIKVPVGTPATILPAERTTLAIFKWRLQQMSPANRWYPVLQRYILYLGGRIRELGGDPDQIPASPLGYWEGGEGAKPHDTGASVTGRVTRVIFDCGGRVEGFVVQECCDRERTFAICDEGLADLVLRACTHGYRVTIVSSKTNPHGVHRLIVEG